MFERVYAVRRPRGYLQGSTWVSLALHGAALLGVAATTDVRELVNEPVARGIFFFAPPPASSAGPTTRSEQITFMELPGQGSATEAGSDIGAAPTEVVGTAPPRGGETEGSRGEDEMELASIFDARADSVYLAYQVDNPVAYDARSLAPAYPDSLRQAGVEGQVTAQFVVDTTGRVDVASFVLLESTHGKFTQAVRNALPGMLFQPAELAGRKIRQLVQLPFLFRIEMPGVPEDTARVDTTTVDTGSVETGRPPDR